jgi:hypothetical protein
MPLVRVPKFTRSGTLKGSSENFRMVMEQPRSADDVQDLLVVLEGHVREDQLALLLHEDLVRGVDHHLGDVFLVEQLLQRPEAAHVVQRDLDDVLDVGALQARIALPVLLEDGAARLVEPLQEELALLLFLLELRDVLVLEPGEDDLLALELEVLEDLILELGTVTDFASILEAIDQGHVGASLSGATVTPLLDCFQG